VKVIAMETPARILVRPVEALDGTPIIDIKTVLARSCRWGGRGTTTFVAVLPRQG